MKAFLAWLLGSIEQEKDKDVAWEALAANLRAFQPKDRRAA